MGIALKPAANMLASVLPFCRLAFTVVRALSLSLSLSTQATYLADWLYLPRHKLVKRTRRMRNASSYAKLLLQQRTSEEVGERRGGEPRGDAVCPMTHIVC